MLILSQHSQAKNYKRSMVFPLILKRLDAGWQRQDFGKNGDRRKKVGIDPGDLGKRTLENFCNLMVRIIIGLKTGLLMIWVIQLRFVFWQQLMMRQERSQKQYSIRMKA